MYVQPSSCVFSLHPGKLDDTMLLVEHRAVPWLRLSGSRAVCWEATVSSFPQMENTSPVDILVLGTAHHPCGGARDCGAGSRISPLLGWNFTHLAQGYRRT